MMKNQPLSKELYLAILVSALGYFVDVYDIILFSAVRVPSLQHIGLAAHQITSVGLWLINLQVLGMLIGGIAWGILGDKCGRLSVLFGSILLYSSATLLNAYVTTVEQYALLRFLAGLGLAGELGAGITLVSELMSKENRGYGTMLIVIAGALGGLVGGLAGHYLSWQMAYILGGLGGFVLLFLRLSIQESTLFTVIKHQSSIKRGSLIQLLSPSIFKKYLLCLLVGTPFWIFVGLFIALAPEVGQSLHVSAPISAGNAILFYCGGLALGEFGSSVMSQILGSRKKVVFAYLLMSLFASLIFFSINNMSATTYYSFCSILGFTSGFWVLVVTLSAEQFGTNLRATVATSLPNLVRAMVIPYAAILNAFKPHLGILWSVELICIGSLIFASIAVLKLKETFSVSLDFIEVPSR